MNLNNKKNYLFLLLLLFACSLSYAMEYNVQEKITYPITITFDKESCDKDVLSFQEIPKKLCKLYFDYFKDNNNSILVLKPVFPKIHGIFDISFILDRILPLSYESGFSLGKEQGIKEGKEHVNNQLSLIQRYPRLFIFSAFGFGAGVVGFAWWLKTRS